MDVYEAIKIVQSRIESLDPENVSKILGYILIQEQGEREMTRLAFSPESYLRSYINQAKLHLALLPFPQDSPRNLIPNNATHSQNPSPQMNTLIPYEANAHGCGNDFDSVASGGDGSLAFSYGEDAAPRPPRFLTTLEEINDGGDGFPMKPRPCVFHARGFCRNGTSCEFLHIDKQQPRFALTPDYIKLRELSPVGARQIYLTFPAESTFTSDDVTRYFSNFGPVEDVRIPHQERRMFGFVAFVSPETVKLVLAKGNPHFVCDCRVLVKPYKDKGKARKPQLQMQHQHQQQCFDLLIGPRVPLSPPNMIMGRNLGQPTDLQHAIELQRRKILRLQLTNNHSNDFQPDLSSPHLRYFSPRLPQVAMNEHAGSFDFFNLEHPEGDKNLAAGWEGTGSSANSNTNIVTQQQHVNGGDSNIPSSSLMQLLPDSICASLKEVAPELPPNTDTLANNTSNSATCGFS